MLPAAERGVEGGSERSPCPLSKLKRLDDTEIASVCTREAAVRIELSLAFRDNKSGILNKEVLDFVDMRLEVSLLSLVFGRRSVSRLRRL
jgi:hypothetical protein